MEFDNLFWRAIDKRFVFQFLFDRAQLLLNFRDLVIKSLALRSMINGNDEQNFAERRVGDWCSRAGFEFAIDNQLRSVEQSRDCFLLAR